MDRTVLRGELLSRRGALAGAAVTGFSAALGGAFSAVAATPRLKVRDLYGRRSKFSELALQLDGQRVEIPGFMAPPLKPDARFFVLTKMPMSVCPFCDNEADWPLEIVLCLLGQEPEWVYFNVPILTSGVLSLGTEIDQETGFVSRVRLLDASFEKL